MTPATSRVEATTTDLFRRMQDGGIRYAFLRNYEAFPSVGSDIDLVMDARDVAGWRRIAAAVAQEHGWDALTECDHWARSSAPHHRIETFCFHHAADNAFLPIDLFHGLLLWGLPVFNEKELLSGRVSDASGAFWKIDPAVENLERILQIYDLHRKRGSDEKVVRYRRKLLDASTDLDALRELARDRLGVAGATAIDHLKRNDMSRFERSVGRGKRHFMRRYGASNPASTALYVFARALEYRRLYLSRQCGFAVRTNAGEVRARQSLAEALDSIVNAKGLRAWTGVNADQLSISWAEHKVMEHGGLVVKWSASASCADITVRPEEPMENVRTEVAGLLIARHKSLHLKADSVRSAQEDDRTGPEQSATILRLEPRG